MITRLSLVARQLKYGLTAFRAGKSYIAFQIFQLILSTAIFIAAFLSNQLFRETIVLALQLLLLFCMIFDLMAIRWVSQGKLFNQKRNIVDFVIILIFTGTLLFLFLTKSQQGEQQSEYESFLQTDDIIIIVIIVLRYGIQVFQMVKRIRSTKKNIEMARKMKDIDLNKTPNSSVLQQGNDVLQDEILRKRINERRQKKDQQNIVQVKTKQKESNQYS